MPTYSWSPIFFFWSFTFMGLLDGFDLDKGLQSFKKSTNTSMQDVKGNVLTPIDVTTNRLQEGIALTNQNDTSVKGRITNYRSSIVEQLDGIVGALSGGLLNTVDLTKAIKVGPDGVKFDTDDIISAVGGNLGYPVYGQTGAMQQIANMATNEFKRLTGLNVGQLIQTNGKTFSVNGNWRGNMGNAVLDGLVKLTGLDDFVDVSVKSSMYNSILYNTALFGMKDAYKSLWDNYPYVGLRQDAFIQAMQHMITNGDIESVDAVVAMLDVQGRNALLNKYPTFVATLFSKFTFADDAYPEDYPVLRTKLLNLLNVVIGPNWYYRETEFGRAYNLGITSRISPDMVTLLSPVEELIPLLCTRGMFSEGSALAALSGSFPDAPINLL